MAYFGKIDIRVDDKSLFSDCSIDVSKVASPSLSWDDDIGVKLLGFTEKEIKNYNSLLGNYYELIKNLNDILNRMNAKDFEYQSQREIIERMEARL